MQFSLTFLAISKSFTISTFTWLVCFVGEGKCHGHITFYFYPEIFCFFSPSPNVNMFFSVCHQLFVCFPQIPMTKPPSKNCAFVSSSYTCCVSLLMAGNTSNCTQQPIYHKRQHPKTIGQLAGKQNSAPRCSFYLQADFFVLFCFFSDWNLRSSLACGAKVKQHQGAFFSRLFLVDDAAAIICFLPAGSPSKSIYGSLCASCRIPLRAEQKWKPRWLGSGLLRASLAVHFSRSKYVRNTRPRRREDERVPYGTFGTKERISRHFLFCFFLNNIFSKGFFRSKTVAFFFLAATNELKL